MKERLWRCLRLNNRNIVKSFYNVVQDFGGDQVGIVDDN